MYMAILFKFVPQCTRTAYSVYGVADCYVTYKLILFPPFCLYFYSSLLCQSCSYGFSIFSILDPFLSVLSLSN